jgi:asparagine synthetase B (glutamine-hydrolysing)
MFAFAIWDRNQDTLFLARDRLGKKPLYYARIADAVAFGSEIKALLPFPGIDRTLDLEAVSKEAAKRNRWDFLVTASPVSVPGATGSVLNPIATF